MSEQIQTNHQVAVNPPQLPKQGGTINTVQATPEQAGATGDIHFSIPLPASEGRGFAPSLSLNYQTTQGNGAFGVGWLLPVLSIRQYTKKGTPRYDASDQYVGPSGEVLEPLRDTQGQMIRQRRTQFGNTPIAEHDVIRYRSRVSEGYERYERWQRTDDPTQLFWLVFGLDGSLHCLGKSPLAQTCMDGRIAEWSLEESLSPLGEHIRYVYQAEDDVGIDVSQPPEQFRKRGALSYLRQIFYGNTEASHILYSWDDSWPDDTSGWLFSVVLDYGEHNQQTDQLAQWQTQGRWSARQDAFSDYQYGFEVRCHRLCRQVLLFHHYPDGQNAIPMNVRRLRLTYDENPTLSRLVSAQEWAYGKEGEDVFVEHHPALLITYQRPAQPASTWQKLPPTPGIDDASCYQLVDLYGEGLPGILYRVATDWRYRSPLRDQQAGAADAISYSDWLSVAEVPSLQNGTQTLADINGDGHLDWVVLQPGLNGFFTINEDKTWQTFTPFSAVPSELLSGQGQFANITGAGLSDVAVIGPQSVRFYANQRDGFANRESTHLDSLNRPLPIFGRNQRTLVAFSDLLGSGQVHLIEVDQHKVSCWPNLGRGEFGPCIELSWNWQGANTFDPQRIYLADIDGSGANDLIYVHRDKLTLYRNQSGNGFATGEDIQLPAGALFDNTCRLSFADLQGSGGMSILLSIPHMTPTHYTLTLTSHKPYLLSQVDNQCGAFSQVVYRHSAQEWLDEKAQNAQAHCLLPLSLYLVKQLIQIDAITGNRQVQSFTYRHGVYDGTEREFRGFGYVETLDSEHLSDDSPDTDSPPLKTCCWYHMGQSLTPMTPVWEGDAEAYTLGNTALAGGDSPPSTTEQWWLNRALTQCLLRQEVYGLDGSALQDNPYTVQSLRYQITRIQPEIEAVAAPILMVQPLEQLHYDYERVSADPRCQHTLTLAFDDYGSVTHQINIDYPRRNAISSAWDAIYPISDSVDVDEQQDVLRLNEALSAHLNEETPSYCVIGLAFEDRQNVIEGVASDIPTGGFSVESLTQSSLMAAGSTRRFAGQQKTYYITTESTQDFSFPPRVASVESAVLDDIVLAAYDGVLSADELKTELEAAGYVQSGRLLPIGTTKAETPIWVAPQALTRFLAAEQFYLPVGHRSTPLVEENQLHYDPHYLMVTSMTDALGNEVMVKVNYQNLTPHTIIDTNNNTQQVTLTPFGHVSYATFYGTEGNLDVGFPALSHSLSAPLDASTLIEQAGTTTQQVASLSAQDLFSWQSATPLPLHEVNLDADHYPTVPEQQTQVRVSYYDGFGRALQHAQRVPPGLAYQRTPEGELSVDDDGHLVEAQTTTRWRISGRVEYNNKGLVVRAYPSYFVDDWRYITDKALRAQGYADTHYYDAMGRLLRVVTTKGYLRRHYYTPWFTVSEDENDTWSETQN
ncbi:hypothetical protein AB835_05485 [Candidatus Endobugula sertula]|uniref:Toxin n=1 Tax=Candidatus Endobugula sertula TaxID=62101 RepID=A0A1D2QR66_9GAMM|nr:hypothetical protein AB835_05485 [Candidatus Endobugula sertula]